MEQLFLKSKSFNYYVIRFGEAVRATDFAVKFSPFFLLSVCGVFLPFAVIKMEHHKTVGDQLRSHAGPVKTPAYIKVLVAITDI